MTEFANNWAAGYGLTWSGKWHIFSDVHRTDEDHQRSLCGAYVYTHNAVPKYVGRLQRISKGFQDAPVCKKCQKARLQ